jgi:hypothetical protein
VPLRRLLAFFVLFAGPMLIAATPTPAPLPPPAIPSPAPTLFGTTEPTIIIYPFEEPSDLDPKFGQAMAQIYGQVLAQSGGMKILAIPTTPIKRVDYDTYAHIQHADYYIGGYIQPIGTNAAIIAQVVDVTNNIAVYSATTQVNDVQDIASQALAARSAIMQAAGIDRPELSAESEDTPTPAPQSQTNGASVSVGNVLGGLFKGKHTAEGGPAPTATPSKPSRGVIVARVNGNAQADTLGKGSSALYWALNARYATTLSTVNSTVAAAQANAMCGSNRDNTIAAGTLNVEHVGGFRAHDSYTFTLDIYACFGAVLYTDTQTDDDYAKAIKSAVEQYYTDHPENNG